jgi:hypothetical protein
MGTHAKMNSAANSSAAVDFAFFATLVIFDLLFCLLMGCFA